MSRSDDVSTYIATSKIIFPSLSTSSTTTANSSSTPLELNMVTNDILLKSNKKTQKNDGSNLVKIYMILFIVIFIIFKLCYFIYIMIYGNDIVSYFLLIITILSGILMIWFVAKYLIWKHKINLPHNK
jgi:glucan phosphoethanolaminetransferase (alkaline phosphatase superfamily)